jgi:hypothetical protein
MSIMRAIARMSAVAALRNMTIAAARVYDSDNTPLNDALRGKTDPLPYITVYTDDDVRQDFAGKDIFQAKRELGITIEIGVMGPVKIDNPEPGEPDIVIPATDASFDLSLDILETQVLGTLLANPRNAWGELFRSIVDKVNRAPSTRGASAAQGARWAARQIVLRVDTIQDVPPGVVVPPAHPVRRFIALARADAKAQLAGSAAIIEATLTQDAAPTWEQAQSWLGLTREGLDAIGIAPLLPDDVTEGPELEEAQPQDIVPSAEGWKLPNGTIVPDFWPTDDAS